MVKSVFQSYWEVQKDVLLYHKYAGKLTKYLIQLIAAAIDVQEVVVVAIAADHVAEAACQVSTAYEEEHHTQEGHHCQVEEGAFQAWVEEDIRSLEWKIQRFQCQEDL